PQMHHEEIKVARAPKLADAGPAHALIEDHALIGDLHTAALVARDGSIDFMCLPDFDSDACFLSLLGTRENGYWKIAPAGPVKAARRPYRPGPLLLEAGVRTGQGAVRTPPYLPSRNPLSP